MVDELLRIDTTDMGIVIARDGKGDPREPMPKRMPNRAGRRLLSRIKYKHRRGRMKVISFTEERKPLIQSYIVKYDRAGKKE